MISRNDYRELHKVADEKHILLTVRDDTVNVYWDKPREIIAIKDKLLSLGLGIESITNTEGNVPSVVVSKIKIKTMTPMQSKTKVQLN